jgi:hypothetical protein
MKGEPRLTSEKFECEDQYEAAKLSGLATVQHDNTTYIQGVSAVIDNEVVIFVKDKSSHSILLKDNQTALRLGNLLGEINSGKKIISDSSFRANLAEIIVD